MRDGVPLPGTTPPVVLSQLAYRVFGPLRSDQVRTMLDFHGLAGHPADSKSAVVARHEITLPTLATWSKMLTTAGARLPLSVALATEVARGTRPGEDHLARTRIAATLGLTAPRPAAPPPTPSPPAPTGPSKADLGAAEIAVRVLATVGPLPLDELHPAIVRARRFKSHSPITAQRLAIALSVAGVTRDEQGRWQAPTDATPPDRYQALATIAAGRDLTRSEMIHALLAAGYAPNSARTGQINDHPLIQRTGPNRYQLVGDLGPGPNRTTRDRSCTQVCTSR